VIERKGLLHDPPAALHELRPEAHEPEGCGKRHRGSRELARARDLSLLARLLDASLRRRVTAPAGIAHVVPA
jgi:hypothetical protein